MILSRDNWDLSNYQELLNYLDSLEDLEYLNFHKSLVLEYKKMRGVRTPLLKNIAYEISKGNYLEFLNIVKNDSYEEIIIHGLVISYLKVSINDVFKYLDDFIVNIDSWAITDIVACNLKIFKKNQEQGFLVINKYIKANNPWVIRFGLVLLIAHYINDNYIDKVLDMSNSIKNDDYYIKMANAWLISICYIKYKNKTNKFLLTTDIDDWTYNKAISKARDSFRVSKEDKDYLFNIKR